MSSFGQFFDSQMAIFRRVSVYPQDWTIFEAQRKSQVNAFKWNLPVLGHYKFPDVEEFLKVQGQDIDDFVEEVNKQKGKGQKQT